MLLKNFVMGAYYTAFEPCAVTFGGLALDTWWALDTYSTVRQSTSRYAHVYAVLEPDDWHAHAAK